MKTSVALTGLIVATGMAFATPMGHAALGRGSEPESKERKVEPKKASRPKVGEVAPAFSLKNAEGKEVTLESLKGKVVVIDFWATWCNPCKKAMPTFNDLHNQYKDKGVVVYGIQVWEDNEKQKAIDYMKDHNFGYGLLFGNDALVDAYGVTGIPSFFVIGADGKVLFEGQGLSPAREEGLKKAVAEGVEAASKKPAEPPAATK